MQPSACLSGVWLSGQVHPERALMAFAEGGDDTTSVGLQRHPRLCGDVGAERRPVWLTLGLWDAGSDELAPVVDHLVGQRLLRRIQWRRAAEIEQEAQLTANGWPRWGKATCASVLGRAHRDR